MTPTLKISDRPSRILLAANLFRRHVVGGTEDGARLGVRSVLPAGDAEVHDLRLTAVADEDVRRLDVAMDDAVLVRVREPAAGLGDDVELLPEGQRIAPNAILEILPLQILHRDEGSSLLVVAEVVDGDDVRVLESRHRFRFALEALLELAVRDDGARHHLQRDLTLESRVEAEVDDTHGSFAELSLDLIFA